MTREQRWLRDELRMAREGVRDNDPKTRTSTWSPGHGGAAENTRLLRHFRARAKRLETILEIVERAQAPKRRRT